MADDYLSVDYLDDTLRKGLFCCTLGRAQLRLALPQLMDAGADMSMP